MVDLRESVISGDGVRPALDGWTSDLDRATAVATHEVVVMSAAALSVDALAVLADDDVDLARSGKGSQGSVHGREADVVALVAQVVVQFLARAKVVDLVEGDEDSGSLPR